MNTTAQEWIPDRTIAEIYWDWPDPEDPTIGICRVCREPKPALMLDPSRQCYDCQTEAQIICAYTDTGLYN